MAGVVFRVNRLVSLARAELTHEQLAIGLPEPEQLTLSETTPEQLLIVEQITEQLDVTI